VARQNTTIKANKTNKLGTDAMDTFNSYISSCICHLLPNIKHLILGIFDCSVFDSIFHPGWPLVPGQPPGKTFAWKKHLPVYIYRYFLLSLPIISAKQKNTLITVLANPIKHTHTPVLKYLESLKEHGTACGQWLRWAAR
jgi:hypothetical protein